MKPSAIRATLRKRPFRPLELVLDNGERIRVATPEILVGDDWIATMDKHGGLILIAPEAVSLIRSAGNGVRHA